MLVRSWNVFHGRTYPPAGTRTSKRRLAGVAGPPGRVCLQELPQWSLDVWRRGAAWPPSRRGRATGSAGWADGRRTSTTASFARCSPARRTRSSSRSGSRYWTTADGFSADASVEWPQERRVSHGVRVRDVGEEECDRQPPSVPPRPGAPGGGRAPDDRRPRRRARRAVSRSCWPATSISAPRPRGCSSSWPRATRRPVRASTTSSCEGLPRRRSPSGPSSGARSNGRVLSDHPPVELRVG